MYRLLADFALAALLLGAYLATMAHGLSWANKGVDGGDLIAAAATGGVAHPTGYPVYLLIARLFQWLPLGSLAFRTNLLSAIAAVTAAILTAAIVRAAVRDGGEPGSTLAGAVAAISFGLAPLVWSHAVITEVYTLHVLFVALLIYLSVSRAPRSPSQMLGIGVTLGIAAGNHVSSLLVAPALLAAVSVSRSQNGDLDAPRRLGWRWDAQAFARACIGMLAGLLIYAILPFRAAHYPPVNWGAPVTLPRLAWLVSGQLYGQNLLQFNALVAGTHLREWAALTVGQAGVLGFALALLGLVVFFEPSKLHFLAVWTALIYSAFGILYAVSDSQVYLLPECLALSIGIGLGTAQLARHASRYFAPAAWLIGLLAVGYFILLGSTRAQQVDASHDSRAEIYGSRLLAQAPPRAIIFAEGDRAVFTLWYFHYALGVRPDVAVMASSLLPFDWYRENLGRTYPDLRLPLTTPGIWILSVRDANPQRPACFAVYPEADLKCE